MLIKELHVDLGVLRTYRFWTATGRAHYIRLVSRVSCPVSLVQRQPNPSHDSLMVPVKCIVLCAEIHGCTESVYWKLEINRKYGSAPRLIWSRKSGYTRLSTNRGQEPAETFLEELYKKHRVGDEVFLFDEMGHLTALSRTKLNGHLDYAECNLVEKLFKTYTMRMERFHETWSGSQFSTVR